MMCCLQESVIEILSRWKMNNPVAGRLTLCYHVLSRKQLAQSKTLCRAYIASVDAENASTQIERRMI
jgi:hypothetical protein